jgi:hypothetical protein
MKVKLYLKMWMTLPAGGRVRGGRCKFQDGFRFNGWYLISLICGWHHQANLCLQACSYVYDSEAEKYVVCGEVGS